MSGPRCQFCGETGNPCACGVPLRAPASIAVLASSPAYPDCALPNDCACLRQGYPKPHRIGCLVPCINAQARELGWEEPYPPLGSDAEKRRNLLADLEVALREGMVASLADDLLGTEAAIRRAHDYLAILRRYEIELYGKGKADGEGV